MRPYLTRVLLLQLLLCLTRRGLIGRCYNLLAEETLQVLPVWFRHRLRLELGRETAPNVLLSNNLMEENHPAVRRMEIDVRT